MATQMCSRRLQSCTDCWVLLQVQQQRRSWQQQQQVACRVVPAAKLVVAMGPCVTCCCQQVAVSAHLLRWAAAAVGLPQVTGSLPCHRLRQQQQQVAQVLVLVAAVHPRGGPREQAAAGQQHLVHPEASQRLGLHLLTHWGLRRQQQQLAVVVAGLGVSVQLQSASLTARLLSTSTHSRACQPQLLAATAAVLAAALMPHPSTTSIMLSSMVWLQQQRQLQHLCLHASSSSSWRRFWPHTLHTLLHLQRLSSRAVTVNWVSSRTAPRAPLKVAQGWGVSAVCHPLKCTHMRTQQQKWRGHLLLLQLAGRWWSSHVLVDTSRGSVSRGLQTVWRVSSMTGLLTPP
jgi:hypothetical protein